MSSKKLYIINSPSYVENHSAHTSGQLLIKKTLDEHYTFFYYNLAKFGLVDEVIIFPRKGAHDDFKSEIPEKIIVESNKSITLNWNTEKAIDIINQNPGSYVYCWSNYEDCKRIINSKVLINPVTLATNSKNCLDKRFHHYALVEGMPHQEHFNVVPKEIPISVFPTTNEQFTNLDVDSIQKQEKIYDWIMVTSCDPRKRHLEFLKEISKNPRFNSLKGCLALKNPDNKGYFNAGHQVLKTLVQKYSKNADIFLNVDNDLKLNLLAKSKIFVCCSAFDCGPRAVIEAIQAGVPIFSQPHIGASNWVYPGKNGELFASMNEAEVAFYKMLESYNSSSEYLKESKIVSQKIKPENIYPSLVKDIKGYFGENIL